MADHQKLESLLRSIIADVQEMQSRYFNEEFGPFVAGSEEGYIEWPNLAILIREAEEVLDDTSN